MAVLPFAAQPASHGYLRNFPNYLHEIDINCTEKHPVVGSPEKAQQEMCTGCTCPLHTQKGVLESWAESRTGQLSVSFPQVPVVKPGMDSGAVPRPSCSQSPRERDYW